MSNNTTEPFHDMKEPLGSRVFRVAICALIFIIALIGNIIVLLIIYKTPSLRSVTGYMIGNLAMADLGVTILCIPMTVVYFELSNWVFGDALCKIMAVVQSMSILASVGTFTFISIDRYRCITRTFSTRISMRIFTYIIIVIWTISLIVALPLGVVNKVIFYAGPNKSYCMEQWPEPIYQKVYDSVFFSVTYALPLIIMFALYIGIAKALKKVVKEGRNREGFTNKQKKDKLLRLLLALVIAYAACFLTYWVIFFWAHYGKGTTNRAKPIYLAYSPAALYLNSAINPMLYAFMGNKFKKGFKALISCQSGRLLQSGRNTTINNAFTSQTEASL